jgi:hypothetical protein
VEVNYEPQQWRAEQLLGRFCHCTDGMPSYVCDELDMRRGSTSAAAAQMLLAHRARA